MNSTSTVSIDDAGPGMTLASDLCDANGSVMVVAGTELSERLIEVLKKRQIAELEIVAQEDEAQRLNQRAKVMQRLAQQYAPFTGDATMEQLRGVFERYHTRGLT